MKFTVKIPVTVEFDLDIDGGIVNHEYIMQDAECVIGDLMREESFLEDMVETITEYTGWCVNSLSLKTD